MKRNIEMAMPVKTVAILSGLDPSGGAGMMVDCAAIRAAGCHPAGVVSVSTIQDGSRFVGADAEDSPRMRRALSVVLDAMDVGAVKIGALMSLGPVRVAVDVFRSRPMLPVILDPVMRSSTGGRLLDDDARDVMQRELFPAVLLLTPNLAEASVLAEMRVETVPDMICAAERILELGPRAVLIKGGHLSGNGATDVLAERGRGISTLKTEPKTGCDVRGTGCALSSLIAAWVARGLELEEAINRSRTMLGRAILNARSSGGGPPLLGDFGPAL